MVVATSRIQDEIQQSRPFRSAGHEGIVALLRTADVVRAYLSGIVEPFGVTLQQYNVLRILRGAGDKGIPTLDIAGRMVEKTPGITRLLDRLEEKGLVKRKRCPEDKRQILCWINAEGQRLLEELDEPVLRADVAALGGISDGDVRSLVALLDDVRAGHAGDNPSSPARRTQGKRERSSR